MADPNDTTQPGLGPVKRKLNKRVLLAAILAGLLAAGSLLAPQYSDIFTSLAQWVNGAGSQ
jgi:hypothetical protein